MKVGVIGFGNLGQAFVKGIISQKVIDKSNIYICANSETTIAKATEEYKVNALSNVNEVIYYSDIVFFVIKKYTFNSLADDIDIKALEKKTIVSFMAGLSVEKIQYLLKTKANIIRAMPSIAIANGNGVIGYTKTPNSDFIVDKIFRKLGLAIPIDEINIEKITAFSACGLGFAAYVLNSFVKAGVSLGFTEKISENIVAQTFSNAIQMSNYSETVLSVATKGGATEQGLECFNQSNLNKIINDAIQRAYTEVNINKYHNE